MCSPSSCAESVGLQGLQHWAMKLWKEVQRGGGIDCPGDPSSCFQKSWDNFASLVFVGLGSCLSLWEGKAWLL